MDPTREEMIEFLKPQPEDEFDVEEAIYWFAYGYHSGQTSNLYSVLSSSPFKPGLLAKGTNSDQAEMFYDELVRKFGALK